MLFRLIVDRISSTILIEAPDFDTITSYIDDIGGKGYTLISIIQSMIDVDKSLDIGILDPITNNDSIIRFNIYR